MIALLTYSDLRRLQQEEQASAALVELPPDFYGQVEETIVVRQNELAAAHPLDRIKEFENTLKVIKDIYHLREQKIVFRALRSSGRQEHEKTSKGMTQEEHKMYDRLVAVLEDNKGHFKSLLEKNAGPEIVSLKNVRVLKELPAYAGADSRVYGPFREGEEVKLPETEAASLVKAKMAEEL